MINKFIKEGDIIYLEQQVSWAESTAEERNSWTCYQQNHVKRRIELTINEQRIVIEAEAAQKAIDLLYTELKAKNLLSKELKIIFHEHYNKLTAIKDNIKSNK